MKHKYCSGYPIFSNDFLCVRLSRKDTGGGFTGLSIFQGIIAKHDGQVPFAPQMDRRNLLIRADASQNYSFGSTLFAETIPVRSFVDLTFDWSGVGTDMLGRDFDPLASVDMMEVLLFRYTKADLLRDINDDNLDRGQLEALAYYETGNTVSSANYLSVNSAGGTPQPDEVLLEYLDTETYPPEEYSYLFMLAEGAVFGQGTKMLVFFEPSPDETNTEVRLTDASTTLDYEVDLLSLDPIGIPPGTSDIVFDWLDEDGLLLTNALGGEWAPNWITEVRIAHYSDMTIADLEERFLEIELLADETWSVFLDAGQSVHLSRLTNGEGAPFTGIDETGTWIITLMCGACAHPAPWFLSVLHACPQ
jgi:hypothetical protein